MLLNKTLATLEYDLIKKKLHDLSSCEVAKEHINNLYPLQDIDEIQNLLDETQDAVNFIIKRGMPPLAGIKDIRGAARRAASGGSLSFSELLSISGVLRAARRIINYSSSAENNGEDKISAYIAQIIENRPFEEKINRCIISEEEMAQYQSQYAD